MKEIWSENPQLIQQEIEALIMEKTVVSLYQPGHPPIKTLVAKIEDFQGETTLLLLKKESLRLPNESCLALYKVPKSPVRAFKSEPLVENGDQLRLRFPSEIVVIQRRKHPRFITSANSIVTYARKGSQSIHRGIVKDLSMEGAKVVTDFAGDIHAGGRLSPLSMTLRLSYSNYEENLTVPEAKVCRVVELSDGRKELGLHFRLEGKDGEALERFLAMRTLEDSSRNRDIT